MLEFWCIERGLFKRCWNLFSAQFLWKFCSLWFLSVNIPSELTGLWGVKCHELMSKFVIWCSLGIKLLWFYFCCNAGFNYPFSSSSVLNRSLEKKITNNVIVKCWKTITFVLKQREGYALISSPDLFLSRVSETQVRVKIILREKGSLSPPRLALLAWGDFQARLRFARSTIPEEKWRLPFSPSCMEKQCNTNYIV